MRRCETISSNTDMASSTLCIYACDHFEQPVQTAHIRHFAACVNFERDTHANIHYVFATEAPSNV